MTIQVALNHKTSYEYDRAVNLSPHVIRLRPAAHSRTPIKAYSLKIEPENHYINWMQDPFGNYEARVVFPEKTTRFSFEVDLLADMTVINPFEFFVESYAEHYPFAYEKTLKTELAPYLRKRKAGKQLKAWLAEVDCSEIRIQDFLVMLNQRLQEDIGYNIRMEPGVQTFEQTLTKATGSCRDTAWLLVEVLRQLGLAARFVSGYLVQLSADEKSLDGPSGPEADFTDLHAWCEVFIPGAGWIGLDPTSGLFASEGHIPLACTPDPMGAAPVTGGMDKCEVINFDFSNTVQRFFEDPRVTKPYTDEQWQAINRLGEQVDGDLITGDVRLTMGGEPTFVSIDDMDHEQWNTGALGADKRKLAGELFLRMNKRFAKGSLLHYGQGKWYPGEEIPRWALNCFWRNDGVAMWQDPALIAEDDTDYKHDATTAEAFSKSLVKHLGLDEKYVIPAFEDKLYFLWKEGTLPANLNSEKADLTDPLERQAIARVLLQGLDTASGFALPLAWDFAKQSWRSAPWEFRNKQLFLIPGDSPMGLRLPLDSLPWQTEEERELPAERCGLEELDELGDYAADVAERYKATAKKKPKKVVEKKTTKVIVDVPHTALSIEARNGCLCIFMPPLTYLEHYLDLLAAVEATAAKLKTPVRIEGYPPPRDYRMKSFAVTPDPGVIEVNIHPSNNWQELVENTEVLYEEARLTRLGTEKFMHDGRHTGTGGGNHVTLGAAQPTDSPFLRRPELLQSLITYWQHHPALSYLFSGCLSARPVRHRGLMRGVMRSYMNLILPSHKYRWVRRISPGWQTVYCGIC